VVMVVVRVVGGGGTLVFTEARQLEQFSTRQLNVNEQQRTDCDDDQRPQQTMYHVRLRVHLTHKYIHIYLPVSDSTLSAKASILPYVKKQLPPSCSNFSLPPSFSPSLLPSLLFLPPFSTVSPTLFPTYFSPPKNQLSGLGSVVGLRPGRSSGVVDAGSKSTSRT